MIVLCQLSSLKVRMSQHQQQHSNIRLCLFFIYLFIFCTVGESGDVLFTCMQSMGVAMYCVCECWLKFKVRHVLCR